MSSYLANGKEGKGIFCFLFRSDSNNYRLIPTFGEESRATSITVKPVFFPNVKYISHTVNAKYKRATLVSTT